MSEAGQQEALSRAATPLAAFNGQWNLKSSATGGQEASGPNSAVEFNRFENTLHAGGRVMVTNFTGRFRESMEAGRTRVQPGQQFGGVLVLAYDAANNQYVELYADDQGKVQVSNARRWEADGQTLRLFHDDYVAEYSANGPTEFSFKLYEGGSQRGEAGRGTPVKSATLQRQ